MDRRFQEAKRAYHSSPTPESLRQLLALKSRCLPHQSQSEISLRKSLIYDIEWCELEHNNDPWHRNPYIDSCFKQLADVLREFCGWSLKVIEPEAPHLIYLERGDDTVFVRDTTPSEAVRFFYYRMRGQPYREMQAAASKKTISVIYGCYGSRLDG